jgi:rod shape-determining protein MreC
VPREADVRKGDLIVTSGLGDRFPGGYPVARVTQIDREEGLSFAVLQARPLAALDRGREVLLIITPEKREQETDDAGMPSIAEDAASEKTDSEEAAPEIAEDQAAEEEAPE